MPSTIVALNDHNQLLTFDSADPRTITQRVNVTGLQAGEDLVAIDYRPNTGQLFGVGTTSRLYVVNAKTGAATQIGNVAFDVELESTYFGIDFNPTNDQIRIVGDLDENLRVDATSGQVLDGNATTGGVQADTVLKYLIADANSGSNPRIAPMAYNNNNADAVQTTLFAIDANLNVLVRIGGQNGSPDPNGGELSTIGELGKNVTVNSGIDIAANGVAFGAFTSPIKHGPGRKPSVLGTINVASGTITPMGRIGQRENILDVAVTSRDETVFALAGDGNLVSFNSGDPGTILKTVALSGMQDGETMATVDFRPADGKLYGVGMTGRVYVINTATGVATQVGSGTFNPALNGTRFTSDFDPGTGHLRVVSDAQQNLRIDVTTGAVVNNAADSGLAFGSTDANVSEVPNVVAIGNDNSFTGTTGSTVFGFDADLNVLVRLGSVLGTPTLPNSGQLSTVGALGLDVTDEAGFDFAAGPGGVNLAALQVEGEDFSGLYRINTATGAARLIGRIGVAGTGVVHDIAIAPPTFQFTKGTLAVDEDHVEDAAPSDGHDHVHSTDVSAQDHEGEHGHVNITVTRTGGFDAAMAVTVNTANGTATAGQDYEAIVNQVVTFQAGETQKTIAVSLTDDDNGEDDETFTVTLTAPTNGGQVGTVGTIAVTIRDND